MNRKIIELLTSNEFKVLELICQHSVSETEPIAITQVEIAEKLNVSKITIYHIFKELKHLELINSTIKGRYFLTINGRKAVTQIESIQEVLNGNQE